MVNGESTAATTGLPLLHHKISARLLQSFMNMNLDGSDLEAVGNIHNATTFYKPLGRDSPCSALPPELLSTILLYAKTRKRRLAHKIPFEVLVSHVSRFWRETALNTPALWSRIDVYSSHSDKWVQHYLEHSLRRPLDIYVDLYRADRKMPEHFDPLEAFQSIIQGISHNLHRIRLFSLLCYRQTTAVCWQSIFCSEDAPILQSFTVKHGTAFGDIPSNFAIKATVLDEGLPQLTSWDTDTPNIFPPPSCLHNLSTLHLHGLDPSLPISSDDFIQLFTSLPSIVNLSLQGTVGFAFWSGMPAAPQFALNNLKSIRLLDGGGLAIRMLLGMSAPQLTSLWLECSFSNFSIHLFDAPQLNLNGRPKYPNLKYLTIVMDNFTMSSGFAKIFPTVTHIHWRYPNFKESPQLIQAFTRPRWSSVQVLVFSAFKEKDAVNLNAALLRIISQRQQSPIPLSKILVDKDHMRWLQRVVPREGLRLSNLVKIELLEADKYPEYWWNSFEERNDERIAS